LKEYICIVKRKEIKIMVSLKNFVEDLKEERRSREERRMSVLTLTLSILFLALSIWATTI